MRSLGTILAVSYKEYLQMRRDPFSVALAVLLPALEIVLFGFVFSAGTGGEHLKTVVLDEERTVESRSLVEAFQSSGYFDLRGDVWTREALEEAIRSGRALVGVRIPSGYARTLARGGRAEIQLVIDGVDPKLALSALNASAAIGQVKTAEYLGTGLVASRAMDTRIEVSPLILFNPFLKDAKFIIPGLIGVVLSDIGIILATFAIVRERERGTLEQLIVSPVQSLHLILGKILPYMFLAVVDTFLVLGIARLIFDLRVAGSFGLLMGMCLVFFFCVLGIGLVISSAVENQMQALLLAIVFIIPPIFLSGLVFPREPMLPILRYIGYAFPLTYFVGISRAIILKGVGLSYIWTDVAALLGFATIVLSLSVVRFRKILG